MKMLHTSPTMPCASSQFPKWCPTQRDRHPRQLLLMIRSRWLAHCADDRNPIDSPAIETKIVNRAVWRMVNASIEKKFYTFNEAMPFLMADGFCNRIRFDHKLLPYAKYMNVARVLG